MSSPFPPSSYPEEGRTGVIEEASKVGRVDVEALSLIEKLSEWIGIAANLDDNTSLNKSGRENLCKVLVDSRRYIRLASATAPDGASKKELSDG